MRSLWSSGKLLLIRCSPIALACYSTMREMIDVQCCVLPHVHRCQAVNEGNPSRMQSGGGHEESDDDHRDEEDE